MAEKVLHTLFYDEQIIVVSKPSGLLAVPGRGPDKQDCVVNRLRHTFPYPPPQPAVHRLDMYTSGIMVLARTHEAHRSLCMQFEKRLVKKTYIALLEGTLVSEGGRIELAFRLDPDNRLYQVYDPVHGKIGITIWKRIGLENNRTRVLFFPETGRTHQLRLHAYHAMGLGLPIVGDALYGKGQEGARMCLHACDITFSHPTSGTLLSFHDEPTF